MPHSLLSKDYDAFSGLAEPRMPRGPSLIFESDGILFTLIAECVASNFQAFESFHAFFPASFLPVGGSLKNCENKQSFLGFLKYDANCWAYIYK